MRGMFGMSGTSNTPGLHATHGRRRAVRRRGTSRERRRVSIGDIVRTVRGLETVEDPIEAGAGSELGHRVLRPLWLELQEETMKRLDGLTLEDLCTRAHRAGIAGRLAEAGDFEI